MADGLLADKTVLVTGAGRSLGAVIAELCTAEGATVVATDITGTDDGPVQRHDVTDAADWSRVVADVVATHGRLDGLVNNAAVILESRPFLDESPDEFARLLDVNVMGVWLGMQGAGRAMRETGGGAIVNISSTAGLVAHPQWAAYAASKFGLRALADSLRAEEQEHGVRVTTIFPRQGHYAMDLRAISAFVAPDLAGHGDSGHEKDAGKRKREPADRSEISPEDLHLTAIPRYERMRVADAPGAWTGLRVLQVVPVRCWAAPPPIRGPYPC